MKKFFKLAIIFSLTLIASIFTTFANLIMITSLNKEIGYIGGAVLQLIIQTVLYLTSYISMILSVKKLDISLIAKVSILLVYFIILIFIALFINLLFLVGANT